MVPFLHLGFAWLRHPKTQITSCDDLYAFAHVYPTGKQQNTLDQNQALYGPTDSFGYDDGDDGSKHCKKKQCFGSAQMGAP